MLDDDTAPQCIRFRIIIYRGTPMEYEELLFDTRRHPLQGFPRNSHWHSMQHFAEPYRISERLYLAPSSEGVDDIEISSRLIAAYQAVTRDESIYVAPQSRPNSGIWEMVKHEFHGEFYRLMENADIPGFACYMRNGLRTGLGYGLGTGPGAFKTLSTPGDAREAALLLLIDRLVSLAEAIGILPHENPEQGRYGKNLAISAAELVSSIESTLAVRIGRPPVIGEFGILVEDQIIDLRVPDDVYSSWRMLEIAETFGLSGFGEIGGGLGGTALQAIRLGATRYTIFDIPSVGMMQGWFLMKTLGSEAVRLYGESEHGQPIALLPYWMFSNPDSKYDLVMNRDSLPEIPENQARSYIAEIAKRNAALLSINQESQGSADKPETRQLRVSELASQEISLRRISRSPHWTRKGYVEELFLPNSMLMR